MNYSQLELGEVFKNVEFFKRFNYNFGLDNNLLDVMLVSTYGMRCISPLVSTYYDYESGAISDTDLDKIASIIKAYMGKYWETLEKDLNTEIDVIKPYNMETTIAETGEVKNTNDNTRQIENSVNAYNSNQSVATSSNAETGAENRNENRKTETVKTVKGSNTNVNVIARLNEKLTFEQIGIIQRVVESVAKMLSCPVYGDESEVLYL